MPLVLVNGMYSHIEVYWEWPQFARFVEASRDEPQGAALRPPRHGHVRPRHRRPDARAQPGRRQRRARGGRRRARRDLRLGRSGAAGGAVRRDLPGEDARRAPRRRAEAQVGAGLPWGTTPEDEQEWVNCALRDLGPGRARAGDRPAHLRRPSRGRPLARRGLRARARQAGALRDDARRLPRLHAHGVRDGRTRGRAHHPRPGRRADEARSGLVARQRTAAVEPGRGEQLHRVAHPGRPADHRCRCGHDPVLRPGRSLRRRDDRLRRVGAGRGGRARPHAGDGALHRHRRLDGQGL